MASIPEHFGSARHFQVVQRRLAGSSATEKRRNQMSDLISQNRSATRSPHRARTIPAVIAMVCMATIFFAPGSASAIGDGQSPSSCGSPVTSYSATARDFYGSIAGYVELRYSSACPGTPSKATWARVSNSNSVTCSPGIAGCGNATVVRNGSNVSTCFMASGAGSCFSGAAKDIGSSSAKATGNAEGTALGGSATTASLSY